MVSASTREMSLVTWNPALRRASFATFAVAVIAAILCVATLFVGQAYANAFQPADSDQLKSPARVYTHGAYRYKLNNKGQATITKYIGKQKATIKVPKSLNGHRVVSIGKQAFSQISKLKTLAIPKGVTRVCDSAFANCFNLKKLSLPSTLKRVDSNAFAYSQVRTLKLPGSLKKIGWMAFAGTRTVVLPKQMKSFDWRWFSTGDGTCTLRNIKVAKGSKYFSARSGVLYNKNKTRLVYYLVNNTRTSFKVPDSVRVIDSMAFDFCFNLKHVKLGNHVTTLKPSAFLGVSVGDTFTLPASVKKLGSGCLGFWGNTKTLVVKTKKLTAKNVRNCLKNSSIDTVIVRVGSTSANRAYAKKYASYFSASNAGKYAYVTY